jgi:hypothetical protein
MLLFVKKNLVLIIGVNKATTYNTLKEKWFMKEILNEWRKYTLLKEQEEEESVLTQDMQDFAALLFFLEHGLELPGQAESQEGMFNKFEESYNTGKGLARSIRKLIKHNELEDGITPTDVRENIWNACVGTVDPFNSRGYKFDDLRTAMTNLFNILPGETDKIEQDMRVLRDLKGFSNSFVKFENFIRKLKMLSKQEAASVMKFFYTDDLQNNRQAISLVDSLAGD